MLDNSLSLWDTPIEDLNLAVRVHNLLVRRKIESIGELIHLGFSGINNLHNIGPKQAAVVVKSLETFLKMPFDEIIDAYHQKQPTTSNRAISPEILELPIAVLGLNSNRVINPLIRANVRTVEELLCEHDSDFRNVRGLGEKGKVIIEDHISSFLQAVENANGKLPNVMLANTSVEPKPLIEIGPDEIPNLLSIIVPLCKAITSAYDDDRAFKFIRYYYGLDGDVTYTLQEIGDAEGISRERVRQVNEKTILRVKTTLLGTNGIQGYFVPELVIQEAKDLLKVLQTQDGLLTEQEVYSIFEDRYGQKIVAKKQFYLKFLLTVFGFKELPQNLLNYNGSKIKGWQIDESVELNKVWQALVSVHKVLLSEVKPLSSFELKMRINRKRKTKIGDGPISYAIKLCPDIEITPDAKYQLRFERLSSVADQAYRVLSEMGNPLHFREIVKEINHRLVVAGFPASAYYRSLTGQMVTDSRFESIGRSGKWKLTEWEHIHTQTTVEIMIEFFHMKNDSATVEEIHNYVIKKRPDIPKQSIVAYLYEKAAFIRVSPSKYALAEWGGKPAPSTSRKGSMIDRLSAEIEEIFANSTVQALPLSELVSELEKRTNIIQTNIYACIKRLPSIETETDPNHKKRKIVKYTGNVAQETHKHKKTLMQVVQQEIENYLKQQPDNRSSVARLAEHIMKNTGCKKQTFYNYLSRMENVKKVTISQELYCYLDQESPNDVLVFPQMLQIKDSELRENIARAVNLLNIDNVDVGLFQLGKIFENELKSLLLSAQAKAAFQVSKSDLSRLASMIDCVVREGIIEKKHHLNFLREERNERAHGALPQKAEREELMRYAPFLGGLYIDYIILIHNEQLKIVAV